MVHVARLTWVSVVLGVLAAGCESKATTGAPAAAVAPARLSKELESCGTTAHCALGLRCLEQACVREARSTVGDFLAARGGRALAAGDTGAAIEAYAAASAAYEGEKLAVPPDLDCAWGTALAAARGQKDKAELAARLLHRCLLALPPGGALRASALATLTELSKAGLDERQLGRPQLADLYLTKAPSKPDTGSLAVSITAEPPQRGKSWTLVAERWAQGDVKAALVGCWDKAYAASERRELAVKLAFKVNYIASEYEDEPGKYTFAAEPPAGVTGADADAAGCVKAALLTPLPELKGLRDGVVATLTVTVK